MPCLARARDGAVAVSPDRFGCLLRRTVPMMLVWCLVMCGAPRAEAPPPDLPLDTAMQETTVYAIEYAQNANGSSIREPRASAAPASSAEIATFTLREIAVTLALFVLAGLAAIFALVRRDDDSLDHP